MPARAAKPACVVRTCATDAEEMAFLLEHEGYELISTDVVPEGRVLRLRRALPKAGQWAKIADAWHGRFASRGALTAWLAGEFGQAVKRLSARGMVHLGDLDAALEREAASHTPALMAVAGRRAQAQKKAAGKGRGR